MNILVGTVFISKIINIIINNDTKKRKILNMAQEGYIENSRNFIIILLKNKTLLILMLLGYVFSWIPVINVISALKTNRKVRTDVFDVMVDFYGTIRRIDRNIDVIDFLFEMTVEEKKQFELSPTVSTVKKILKGKNKNALKSENTDDFKTIGVKSEEDKVKTEEAKSSIQKKRELLNRQFDLLITMKEFEREGILPPANDNKGKRR